MEKVKVKLLNMDKPNRNGRYYSKGVIDEALKNASHNPLLLLDRLPNLTDFEQGVDLSRVIGKCVESKWEDNDKTLTHTFEISNPEFLKDRYPCFFGKGEASYDTEQKITIIEDFNMYGFGLAASSAWDMKIAVEPKKRIAIVPGSFDPITIGHMDIIKRASEMYDQVYVAVMINASKNYMFTLAQREEIAKAATAELNNVIVISSSDWLWKLAEELDACAIIKGYRNEVDLEYEQKMAEFNAEKNPKARTILLKCDEKLADVSSTKVREMLYQKQDLNNIVPTPSIAIINKIMRRNNMNGSN